MKKIFRYIGSIIFANFIRLLKVIPNNDPIMGVMLPYARKDKWWQPALFAFFAMASFDILTGKLGIWTAVTSITYGLIAVLASIMLKRRKTINYLTYIFTSIGGILLFDLITGPVMSSILFKMSFYDAFIGQVPFTFLHLINGVAFTAVFCPVLDAEIDQRFNIIRQAHKIVDYVVVAIKHYA